MQSEGISSKKVGMAFRPRRLFVWRNEKDHLWENISSSHNSGHDVSPFPYISLIFHWYSCRIGYIYILSDAAELGWNAGAFKPCKWFYPTPSRGFFFVFFFRGFLHMLWILWPCRAVYFLVYAYAHEEYVSLSYTHIMNSMTRLCDPSSITCVFCPSRSILSIRPVTQPSRVHKIHLFTAHHTRNHILIHAYVFTHKGEPSLWCRFGASYASGFSCP